MQLHYMRRDVGHANLQEGKNTLAEFAKNFSLTAMEILLARKKMLDKSNDSTVIVLHYSNAVL